MLKCTYDGSESTHTYVRSLQLTMYKRLLYTNLSVTGGMPTSLWQWIKNESLFFTWMTSSCICGDPGGAGIGYIEHATDSFIDSVFVLILSNVQVNSCGQVGTAASEFVELLPDIEKNSTPSPDINRTVPVNS